MITCSPDLYKSIKKDSASRKKTIKLRIVFMGTGVFAQFVLKKLLEKEYNIVGAYTQLDKSINGDRQVAVEIVKKLAQQHGLPVFQPEKFTPEEINRLRELNPDIIVVASFGKILPPAVLSLPGFGCLNVHASFLPEFRGPSPLQNALLLGKKETGATIMLMDSGIDTGDILAQKKFPILENDTYETLLKKTSSEGSELLLQTIPLWIEGKIEPQKQDLSKATLCQLIERNDGKIIWEEEAEKIYNRFRAFHSWPGIFTFWDSKGVLQRLKLTKISFQKKDSETPRSAGEVFKQDGLVGVQTLQGIIILEEINPEGKNNMAIKEFLNGYPHFIGSVLK